jgi:hypothetical protein
MTGSQQGHGFGPHVVPGPFEFGAWVAQAHDQQIDG